MYGVDMRKRPITKKRMETVRSMARSQASMLMVADAIGMNYDSYRRRLGAYHSEQRQLGFDKFKRTAYTMLDDIEDPSKRHSALLSTLDKVQPPEYTINDSVNGGIDVKQSILDELADE